MNGWSLILARDLLQSGLYGGVLALLVILVRGVCPKSALPCLWGTALLRFLLPFSVRSPLSVYGLADRGQVSAGNFVTVTMGEPAHTGLVIMGVWAAGSAVTAGALVFQYLRSRRALRVALPLHGCEAVDRELSRAGRMIARHVRVYTCEGLGTPLSCGVLRPRILLPASMDLNETTFLVHTMLHEIEHIRGGHNLLKLVSLCALCLHWMNPLAWAAVWLLGRDLELCCDEGVLRRLGTWARKGYALSLLRLAEKGRRPSLFTSGFGRTAVESRVRGIAGYRRRGRLAFAAAVAMAPAGFFLFACTPPEARMDHIVTVASSRAASLDESSVTSEMLDIQDAGTVSASVEWADVLPILAKGSGRRMLTWDMGGDSFAFASETEINGPADFYVVSSDAARGQG